MAAQESQESPPCSYVDILPTMLEPTGTFSPAVFEPFSALIPRANDWLAGNPGQEVVSCESIETKLPHRSTAVDNNAPNYLESGRIVTDYVRFLRIWVRPRTKSDPAGPTAIGYVNVVPACVAEGGTFTIPQFETFGQTIGHINEMFKTNPLPGKILNVETLDTKFDKWKGGVDADVTIWRKSTKVRTVYLSIIRVFYKQGQPMNEQIGTIDFVPLKLGEESRGLINIAKFEPFSSVMTRANVWLKEQPPMNIINLQSLDYKMEYRSASPVDTQHTCFYESSKVGTQFMRILRVVYLTGGTSSTPSRNIEPTYRTFEPYQLSQNTMTSMGTFENLTQTMDRAQAWLKVTGARVIAVESVLTNISPVYRDSSIPENSERTWSINSAQYGTPFVVCLRFYFDGPYREPAPEQLPPAPEVIYTQETIKCCSIL